METEEKLVFIVVNSKGIAFPGKASIGRCSLMVNSMSDPHTYISFSTALSLLPVKSRFGGTITSALKAGLSGLDLMTKLSIGETPPPHQFSKINDY